MSDRFWNRLELEKEVARVEGLSEPTGVLIDKGDIVVEKADYANLLRAAMDYHDRKCQVEQENKRLKAESARFDKVLEAMGSVSGVDPGQVATSIELLTARMDGLEEAFRISRGV